MNQVTLTGNLTKDPYFKEGDNDKKSFLSFRIAVNTDYKDTESVLFVPVKCFGYTALDSSQLKKGDRVVVTGRPYKDVWDKDEGEEVCMGVSAEIVGKITRQKKTESDSEVSF